MYGHFGQPGQTALVETQEVEIFWGGDASRIKVLQQSGVFSSTLADAANTPTTLIRPGLLLGKITASGQMVQWDRAATDGSQNIAGVLPVTLLSIDEYATAVNRVGPYVVEAPLKASSLRIKGALLVGHADEYLARRQLFLAGFKLDDDPMGYLSGMVERTVNKITSYTVVKADNGTLFTAITADATFTLPALAPGLQFDFLRASDHEFVVASAEGDNVIVGNDLSADSVTFTTAGQQIGARMRVKSIDLNGTLKWLPEVVVAPYSTGALMASAIAT